MSSSAPLLILVGADKGGVGKTMVARALLAYLAAHGATLRIFDSEPKPGVLARFHKLAQLADIGAAAGQMQILDARKPGAVTVVDIRAGLLSRALKSLSELGMLNDVREHKLRLMVLHVLGNTVASLSEIATTAAQLAEGGAHILVKNYASDKATFFEWDAATHESYFKAIDPAGMISIPHLDELSCETAEKAGVPFSDFLQDESISLVLRRYARAWLAKTWAEFDRIELAKLAAKVAP